MPKLTKVAMFIALLLYCFPLYLTAQDTPSTGSTVPSDKLLLSLTKKSAVADERIDKATEKYLSKLLKQEKKLQKKIAAKDSSKAQELFADTEEQYDALKTATQKPGKYGGVYSGHLDSLNTALKFFKASGLKNSELQKTLSQFSSLQDKFNQTQSIKKFISERKQLLKEQLGKLGMLNELKSFQKEAYYYSMQLREVKAMWEDPSKMEKKLMEWAVKSDKFKDFFRQNSQLASLFALPGGNSNAASLTGLQTRASVQSTIVARFGNGPNVQAMMQQNMQAAQGQLNDLKNKLSEYGSGSYGNSSSDIDLPEGFKPNSQKTKTFLQRLEYGANIQSQKARSYFPTTSDIGLSLGYKFNDKSSVGVGISYKLGWGRSWNHIRMTSEGLGLRSYLDSKLKGSLYISGGYEQNYQTAFNSIEQLKNYSAWQMSGLLGLCKKYKVSKKLKGEMKLLWDFLSYQQVPRTQPIVFRIGYILK